MNKCWTSTRVFKKKVWLSINPKGLAEYTDDALEVKPTTLKYLTKKSDIFEDDEALIMNERMLCGHGCQKRGIWWAIGTSWGKSRANPVAVLRQCLSFCHTSSISMRRGISLGHHGGIALILQIYYPFCESV